MVYEVPYYLDAISVRAAAVDHLSSRGVSLRRIKYYRHIGVCKPLVRPRQGFKTVFPKVGTTPHRRAVSFFKGSNRKCTRPEFKRNHLYSLSNKQFE